MDKHQTSLSTAPTDQPTWATHLVHLGRLHARERLEPAHDAAEHRVLVVEVAAGLEGDEELRAVRVAARVGHGEDAALVVQQPAGVTGVKE